MNLEDLRSVRNTERRKDSLQELRPTFYRDVGQYISSLSEERARLAAAADDPFADPEIVRLTDEIQTATDVAEAIYERRMGKVVKQASLAAAGMTASVDGLTAEEAKLFDDLVARIEENKTEVFAVLDGNDSFDSAATGGEPIESPTTDLAGEGDQPVSTDEHDAHGSDDSPGSTVGEKQSKAGSDPDGVRDGDETHITSPDRNGDSTVSGGLDAAAVMGGESSVEGAESSIDGAESSIEGAETSGRGAESSVKGAESSAVANDSRTDTVESTVGADEMETPPPPPPDADPDPTSKSRRPEETTGREDDVDRLTVRITTDVGSILGVDDREYTLAADDVVTLPEANATPLIERDAAEPLQ